MSIDFDSGALQTQHEDDDDEYDKEDYAREQELQKLLTDLPHDMLDDSLCSSSEHNFSDCSDHEISEQNQHWDPEAHWVDDERLPEHQKYKNGYTDKQISAQFVGQQSGPPRNQGVADKMSNGWGPLNGDKEENIFNNKYNYHKEHTNEESNVGTFHSDSHYDEPDHCSTSELYHLPEDFKPYSNGGRQLAESFPDAEHDKFQIFIAPEGNGHQPAETLQIKYNPYQLNAARKDVVNPDLAIRDDHYDDLQREFLDTGECTSSNMQYVQLQVLYKARGRQLEELNAKLEESERQLRYLGHQLAVVKDEKDGLSISLQESQMLLQNSREMELQLRGQMAALEKTVDGLTSNDEQLRKELKVSKLAMDSMQQQVMDLRRSDSIHRAREQHEAVVSMLKQKNEEQVLSLQQKLDEVNIALQQQKEICSRLEEHVKQAERKQEESKLEKNEIINRLSRSLEESQKQCANLLHTDSIQETTKLLLQLQQLQSSKMISDGMNKALQEEVNELKLQITMYESAAKIGVFINGEEQEELSDSYVDLGIKKINWQKSRFHRIIQANGVKKKLSSDEMIIELKAELERCLSSNKTKRQQVVQLQSDLKAYQSKTEELKKLLENAEKEARDCKASAGSFQQLDSSTPYRPMVNGDKEIQRLQDEKQQLQQDIEKHLLCIKELAANEEKLKAANQQLCSEMRKILEDSDNDKKESIQRCERTYEQHHEDIKKHLIMELSEKFEAEKEQLCQTYENKLAQLQSQIHEMNNEMTAVQECYIAVCKEKDTLEDNIRDNVRKEAQLNEEKWREKLFQDKDMSLQTLKMELENMHQSAMSEAKAQWQRVKEAEMTNQFEVQLSLAKDCWIKEHQQMTEITIEDIEKEWKHKLDTALKGVKSVQNMEDQAVQTEQTSYAQTMLEAEKLNELKVKLQNAVQEKERAVREARMELELQHREDFSNQVELALTKAHARWLQELTCLSEYKANLRFEKDKWEKLNDVKVKKQISDAVAAAEEKWKQGTENVKYNIRHKELEEQITSLKRELDRQNEEFEAQMKVELSKARAQWNKEKQEEVQHMQAQNEKDYRMFLDEHRTKISEVLSTAKVDFEKQKNELIAQKETEMTERYNQILKQRTSEESRKICDHDNEILSEIERLMSEIHDELIEKSVGENHFSYISRNLDVHFLEKLKCCLQKSVKGIAYKIISNAKQEWKRKHDENQASLGIKASLSVHERSYDRSTEDVQKNQKIHTAKLANGNVQTIVVQTKNKKDSPVFCCCEKCLQQLEKSNKECQELRNKLDKACRHLQQAVKDEKLKAERFRENETIVQTLRRENVELNKKLDKTTKIAESLQPEEGSEGCSLCKGKALEEMRAQYIKAVDKIKNDMFHYIHESKGRAAEMLKSEVLRERQETARKMRKYYLTCLQQLLKDDGKNEGAEKKIMNAASKLATMAKVLETPISQKLQNRNLRAASKLSKDETDTNKSQKNFQTHASDRSTEPNTEQRALDELIRKHMKEKFDDKFSKSEDVPVIKHNVSEQLRMDCADQRPALGGRSTSSPLEEGRSFKCTDESVQSTFGNPCEPSFLHGLKDAPCHEHPKTRSDRQMFELQETPVRDENGSNEWSCAGGKGPFPTQAVQSSLTSIKVQSHIPNAPGNLLAAGLFSFVEGSHETFGSKYEGQIHSANIAKRRDQTLGTRYSSKTVSHPPPAVELKPYSDVGRGSQLSSRKLLLDFASLQQDSGFDSPLLPNLNSFN
ncbi:centrosomal protein of 152 kDa isoform X2 [Mixophyes fleayi]|uniref:centrosomal protein of 152 kDa isoform X2 n=1 Tax=Mixophyes fleayi TaxID=3061075 RepID=UPI003F4D8F56